MALSLKIFDIDFTPIQVMAFSYQLISTLSAAIWDDIKYIRSNRHNQFAITPWTLRNLREGSVLMYTFGSLSTSSARYTIKELVLLDDKCYVFKLEHENKNYTMITMFYHCKIYRYWKIVSY